MTDFATRITAALDTFDAAEAGRRVHEVVADEVRELDPTVVPELTGYFNHSFVPDLMLSWKDDKKAARPMFLRHSLLSSQASGDFADLGRADKSALFLSLALEEPTDEILADGRKWTTDRRSRAAVTTVPAINELTRATDPDPVLGMVRASVVRSARGILAEDEVENLVLPRGGQIEPQDLEAFSDTVERSFTEDAALRINRVFGVVEQAVSAEPDLAEVVMTGSLTPTEILELVPYLLSLEGVAENRQFWTEIAGLISLEEIERLWGQLVDLDLTPLASAASGIWRAKRAQLSIRSEVIDDDADRTPRWGVTGRLLSAGVGDWRITYAFSQTKIRATGRDGTPARWPDLRPTLEEFTVTGANLSGVVAKNQYDAQEGADMKERIDGFIATTDDSFHVPAVTVQVGVGDERAQVEANFSEMQVTAEPHATLADMTRIAVDVLGYRHETPEEEVSELLGDGGSTGIGL